MLDQSFSLENFKILFEIENRKGSFNKKFFSNEYYAASEKLIAKRLEIKNYGNKDLDNNGYVNLLNEKNIIIDEKEEILNKDISLFSNIVNKSNFSFKINDFVDPKSNKTIYAILNDSASYFAMKQLQHNVFRTFKVIQTNRFQIIRQVKNILQDNLPKYVIRTDIEGFYENVPQNKLLELIEENQLLSPKSKMLINNLLYDYNRITDQLSKEKSNRVGIPRGAGISAYLAELFMRGIDRKIKELKNVTFYGRYVDDIIVVFTPTKKCDNNYFLNQVESIVNNENLKLKKIEQDSYLSRLQNTILESKIPTKLIRLEKIKHILSEAEKELELKFNNTYLSDIKDQILLIESNNSEIDFTNVKLILNSQCDIVSKNKTFEYDIYCNNKNWDINYLGYNFKISKCKFTGVFLTKNKKDSYKIKIEKTFDAFLKESKYNYKYSKKLLIHRLNYLTKNTRLDRPKKGLIGIYYSNSLLDENCSCLDELNDILLSTLNQKLANSTYDKLRSRLKRYCFKKGFNEKLFFNINSLKKKIPDLRSNKMLKKKPLENNFERIISVWK